MKIIFLLKKNLASPRFISLLILSSLVAGLFLIILPQISFAQDQFGLTEAAKKGGLIQEKGEPPTLAKLTGRIIGSVLALVGVIFLILVIYGGVTWMTAGGNEEKIKKAKGLIVNSVIGLIIILAAYSLVNFIFTSLTATTTK